MAQDFLTPIDLPVGAGGGLPLADKLRLFANKVAGRLMLSMVGPTGLDVTLQPHMTRNKVAQWNPPGNVATVPAVFGQAAVTSVGTATARNVGTTNRFTRMRRLGYTSTAVAGTLGGFFTPAAQFTVGTGTDGGFHLIMRFGCSDAATVSGARSFAGMQSGTATPLNVEPNTLTNCIGIGAGAADTNMKLFFGGSAAQTPVDLGANFPANTLSVDPYELSIFSVATDNTQVQWMVENLRTGNIAEGTITNTTPGTTLPSTTTFLGVRAWRCNNATALTVGVDIVNWSVETDF
jgi:hypothetical protein